MFGPQRGAGHYETLLPSARFSLNPFDGSSSYRSTHQHPGIIVLCLRRDPSAQTPWGFEVSCDEFGHACLVKDVQPMSPASEAVSLLKRRCSNYDFNCANSRIVCQVVLGSPHTLGLKVHDMLLMINGRLVGGMTEVGLEVELELSGHVMYLAVAQYKHARITSSQRASLEMRLTSTVDEALRDERVVGWREIGYGEKAPLPLDTHRG